MSYQAAMAVLSQPERDRMLSVLLNSKIESTDWDAARADLQTEVKKESLKRMYNMSLKKIQDAITTGGSKDGKSTTKGAAGGTPDRKSTRAKEAVEEFQVNDEVDEDSGDK